MESNHNPAQHAAEEYGEHSENNTNPLSVDFTLWSLLRFSFPTIVMMIFMGLYTIVDTVFVSRLVNTYALSAINIVCPVINLIVGFGTMLATGGSAVVAYKMGEGKEREACENFTMIVVSGVVAGGLIAGLGIMFLNPIIYGLGASELLFPYCRAYLLVLMLFTPASILQVLFQSLIVTAGRPGLGMALSVSAGLMNILLDYIFMVPMKMGIAGSALATGIGYMMPAVIGVCLFSRPGGNLRFRKTGFSVRILWKSCSNGYSEMVGQIATAVTTFLFNGIMMRLLGEDGVGAITITIYTQFLLITLFIGFSMGVAPVISYNYGSGNSKRLKRIFKCCVTVMIGASLLVFIAAILGGNWLTGIFVETDSAVYSIASHGFKLFSFGFLFCGLNIFTSAMFTAFSDGRTSAVLATMRTLVLITAFLLVLPVLMGVDGVWLAVPAAELCACFISIYALLKKKRQYGYLN